MAIIRVTNVPSTALSDDVITSAKIADGTIAVSDLANDSVTADKIASNAVTSTKVADGAITTGHMHSSVPLGTKNLIINGDMRIAQRGTSVTGQSNVGGGYRTVDRFAWQLSASMGTWTQAQSTDAPEGFSYSLKHTCTSVATIGANNDAHQIFQRIEGQNLQQLKYGTANAESLTVSFWVKSNLTGTYTVSLYGNNGSSTRQIGATVTIDSADTWEKKTVTFVGDTVNILQNNNGQGINFTIWLACGTNRYSSGLDTSWVNYNALTAASPSQTQVGTTVSDYFAITGVQLEVGTEATPFEHRPYDMELARCLRYYEKSYQITDTPGTAVGYNIIYSNVQNHGGYAWSQPIRYRVEKRATATITPFDYQGNSGYWKTGVIGSTEQAGLASIGDNSSTGFRIYTAYTSTPNATYGHWTASSEL